MRIAAARFRNIINCALRPAMNYFEPTCPPQEDPMQNLRPDQRASAATARPVQHQHPTIQVRAVQQYGATAYYPVCERAQLFAAIAGTKTLTYGTIRSIQDLGFLVYCEPVNIPGRYLS